MRRLAQLLVRIQTRHRGSVIDPASYEVGHRDGESSCNADWAIALDDVLPDNVDETPSAVAAYIRMLQDDG